MNIRRHFITMGLLTLLSVGLVYATTPEFIIKTITLNDGSNTVCLGLSGDAIYHDTDADGVKDAGENFINADTTALAANVVPRSTGSALVAGVITDDGTKAIVSSGGIQIDGTGSYTADSTQIYNTASGGTIITATSGSSSDLEIYNSAGARVLKINPNGINFILDGKYTDADGDTAIDLEESADDDTIRLDAGDAEITIDGDGIHAYHLEGGLGNGHLLLGHATVGGYLHYTQNGSGRVALGNLNNSGGTGNQINIGFGDITSGVPASVAGRFDRSTTAGDTRFMLYDVDNATLERVTVGAADSGGSGYKVLRIPN